MKPVANKPNKLQTKVVNKPKVAFGPNGDKPLVCGARTDL